MALERELKLGAGPGFHLPPLDGIDGAAPSPPDEKRLDTVYWDTADLRLARWGCSLRHRVGEGWTLKLAPVESDGQTLDRPEIEEPGPARRPPGRLLGLVRALVRSAELKPVARLSTMRRKVVLRGPDGGRLLEVVDDEVTVLEDRRVALRFREVEVEVAPGGDGVLPAVLERLRQAGAGGVDPTPKHVRALGPLATLPEVDPGPSDGSSGAAARRVLADAVAGLIRHDPGVRTGGDPEDVHQARVSARQIRSCLRSFRDLFDPDWARALEEETRFLAGELGAVRDAEVLLERLRPRVEALGEDARAAARLVQALEADVEAKRATLVRTMESRRYLDLLDELVVAVREPQLRPLAQQPADEALPHLAGRAFARLRREARAMPDEPLDEALHHLRISTKRARYAIEAAAIVAGPEAARMAKAAARLQTILGEHQDAVTAQAWLREHAGSGRGAFAAGRLYADESRAAQAARADWPGAWRDVNRKKLRAWIG